MGIELKSLGLQAVMQPTEPTLIVLFYSYRVYNCNYIIGLRPFKPTYLWFESCKKVPWFQDHGNWHATQFATLTIIGALCNGNCTIVWQVVSCLKPKKVELYYDSFLDYINLTHVTPCMNY